MRRRSRESSGNPPTFAYCRMPAKSRKQLAAMYAAAAGHSTLGIPASVGAEYVAATPKKKRQQLMDQIRSHLTRKGKLRRGD